MSAISSRHMIMSLGAWSMGGNWQEISMSRNVYSNTRTASHEWEGVHIWHNVSGLIMTKDIFVCLTRDTKYHIYICINGIQLLQLTETTQRKYVLFIWVSIGSANEFSTCLVSSHFLNQCWLLTNWVIRNNFQWNFYGAFDSRERIWTCCLQNRNHFVPVPLC